MKILGLFCVCSQAPQLCCQRDGAINGLSTCSMGVLVSGAHVSCISASQVGMYLGFGRAEKNSILGNQMIRR